MLGIFSRSTGGGFSPKSHSIRRKSSKVRKNFFNGRQASSPKNDSSPAKPPADTQLSPRGSSPPSVPRATGSFELKKHRIHVPVTIFDKPLVSELEFIVDPRYQSLKMLGCGSFGVVVSAVDSRTGSKVAIKRIDGAFSSIRMARYVLRELRLLRHLKHPNIVDLLDVDMPNKMRYWDEVYIVTNLLKMDLTTAFQKGLVRNVLVQKKIAYHLLLALEHMHASGLFHRDIKPKNILLDEHLNAQLCDLGHSRFYSKANRELDLDVQEFLFDEPELSGVITTMIQSAPELTLGGDYDSSVDIWAAGCVIAQLVRPGHRTLFDNTGKNSHMSEILRIIGFPSEADMSNFSDYGQRYLSRARKNRRGVTSTTLRETLGVGVDTQVIDLLEHMLCFSASRRPSATEALKHPWFDDVRQPVSTIHEAYDFAKSEPGRKTTKAELKQLAWEEVTSFHPEVLRESEPEH